ncbi:MAG: hypothetical protein AAGN35_23475 [Bacteroidota bacterium]
MKLHSIIAIAAVLLFTVSLTSCGGSGKYANSTPKELGESLFAAVKANDAEGMLELFPTKDDMLSSLNKADIPSEQKDEMVKKFSSEWPEMQKEMKSAIESSMKEISNDVKVEELELVEVKADDIEEREGFEQTNVEVMVKAGEKAMTLEIRRAGHMESGWVMSPRGFRVRE